MTQTVTTEDVQRVAELASLELTSEEETRMVRDLNAILGYVQHMNELDTANIEPMAQVGELAGHEALRPDDVAPSLRRDAVMAGAPETDGVFFKVPKVIER
ncbi:MAG: Asp-tRNA(Asn)/Glu-tRNA(Gln) amidotransferase subunit GatC [Acidobacteria bacterium]|nr:Asp-tRNA(Asn)/Glu-tRNA(Gln) amidotransferase subunit GatC [Acidobacteriota bacterium]MBW4046271.1 Asp-tRNA(Asn)/Glu-tRNA(Gln) amidotransferase subunit GatC [Acidobacteriota bacterium]